MPSEAMRDLLHIALAAQRQWLDECCRYEAAWRSRRVAGIEAAFGAALSSWSPLGSETPLTIWLDWWNGAAARLSNDMQDWIRMNRSAMEHLADIFGNVAGPNAASNVHDGVAFAGGAQSMPSMPYRTSFVSEHEEAA